MNESEKFQEGESWPIEQKFGPEEWPSRSFGEPHPDKRPEAGPEVTEKMDRELRALADLMNTSGLWWQLDGALNISAWKGEYVGQHADVDIAVFEKDLPELDKHLEEKGHGLFWCRKEGDIRIFKRIGAKNFADDYGDSKEGWQLRVMAVGNQGKINLKADLASAEVSLISEGENGEKTQWYGSLPVPKGWLEQKEVDFHGARLSLSHPARLLFNKMIFDRGGYDTADIEEILKLRILTQEDYKELQRLNQARFDFWESSYQDSESGIPNWIVEKKELAFRRMAQIEASI